MSNPLDDLAAAAHGNATPAADEADAQSWLVHQDGRQLGPFAGWQIRQMMATGGILPAALIWREGLPSWLPVHRVFPPQVQRRTAAVAEQAGTTTYAVPASWSTPGEKPRIIGTLGALRLASGCWNCLWGFLGAIIFFPCFILFLLLIPLGICEIVSGVNLMSARPKPGSHRGLTTIPIMEIIAGALLSIPSLVLGILGVVFAGNSESRLWISR